MSHPVEHKQCSQCRIVKPLIEFYGKYAKKYRGVRGSSTHNNGYSASCKVCHNKRTRKNERILSESAQTNKVAHSKLIIQNAKHRARVYHVPFRITYKDIPIPAVCPVLGIPLIRGRKKLHYNSATVDRIVPELGYVPGNVIVISLRANVVKNNASVEEILKVGHFYGRLTGKFSGSMV